jgi:hypothetical protein
MGLVDTPNNPRNPLTECKLKNYFKTNKAFMRAKKEQIKKD